MPRATAAMLRADPVHEIAGRYLVEAALGRGGMGAVHRVRDKVTGRELRVRSGSSRKARGRSSRRAPAR